MTAPDNPLFARAAVNRMWGYFFGRGIVDPVDDFRSTNPPTHPELLEALARHFQEQKYDLKDLIRTIVQSRTYQLSGRGERDEPGRRGQLCPLPAARPRRGGAARRHLAGHGRGGEIRLARSSSAGGPTATGTRAIDLVPEITPVPVPGRLRPPQPADAAGEEPPAQPRPGVAHAGRADLHRKNRRRKAAGSIA